MQFHAVDGEVLVSNQRVVPSFKQCVPVAVQFGIVTRPWTRTLIILKQALYLLQMCTIRTSALSTSIAVVYLTFYAYARTTPTCRM